MITLDQAAEYLGMTPGELMLSRMRGLPPGKLGYALDGQVYFMPGDLLPPSTINKPQVDTEPEEIAPTPVSVDLVACEDCGREFKSTAGLASHTRSKHDSWGYDLGEDV